MRKKVIDIFYFIGWFLLITGIAFVAAGIIMGVTFNVSPDAYDLDMLSFATNTAYIALVLIPFGGGIISFIKIFFKKENKTKKDIVSKIIDK
ncbi:MAG: hypothetical protein HRS57_03740 [Mycoplasmataceae bacterium]|nr:hypothetical protein [Mycoplasmataceae bacterium]